LNRRTTISAALVVSLALAASACGGGDDDSEGETAAEAAQSFVTALEERDFATACSYFAEEELEERMGGEEQCEKSMDVTTPEDPLPGFEITGTREGEVGETIVEFETEDGKSNEFSLVLEENLEEAERAEAAEEAEEAREAEGKPESEEEAEAEEEEEAEEAEEEESSEQESEQRGDWVFFEG
jgi:hypothetical protein